MLTQLTRKKAIFRGGLYVFVIIMRKDPKVICALFAYLKIFADLFLKSDPPAPGLTSDYGQRAS